MPRVADADHILNSSASPMSSRKSRKPHKTYSGTPLSGSGSSGQPSSSKRIQVYDTVNTVLDVAANVAEATDVLTPLKAACKAAQSILQVARVRWPIWQWRTLTNVTGYRDQSRGMDRPRTASRRLHVSSRKANHLVRNLSPGGKSCRRGIQPTSHPIRRVRDKLKFYYDSLTNPDTSKIFITKLSRYAKNKVACLD